jgi:hypothetical protein
MTDNGRKQIMKKLIGSLCLVVALALGTATFAPVDNPLSTTQQADAHAANPTPLAWCTWQATRLGFIPDYYITDATYIHYGLAHVYYCRLQYAGDIGTFNVVCMQEVFDWYYGWLPGSLDWWYPLRAGPTCPRSV